MYCVAFLSHLQKWASAYFRLEEEKSQSNQNELFYYWLISSLQLNYMTTVEISTMTEKIAA
mgnify:CR=1 FL=1